MPRTLWLLFMIHTSLGSSESSNRLQHETSPYLQQHASQPVDWYAWGEEAFAKAKKEQKPILLSIGYSTCHWCHVMARESFSDHDIAEYLNEQFVSIKLDREERPDIDQIYMTAHQAMHDGAGGWPLNVFLTPDLRPFFSGTYFPPRAKEGRAGFDDILKGVADAWKTKREKVVLFSAELTKKIEEGNQTVSYPTEELGANFLNHTRSIIRASGDQKYGGWGRGPKFPQPSLLRFLLGSDTAEEREFALKTCRTMAESGLYDQINGGFHRYCVDGQWIVPHFEKMLYDQAQLIEVYLDAYLVSGEELFRSIAQETCEYLLREMTSEAGAFYSAQDAQSENKEGKFCCWTVHQLRQMLTSKQFSLAEKVYDLSEGGNFLDFSDPEPLKNLNVLTVKTSVAQLSEDEKEELAELKTTLFQARENRVPPATDRKILLNWNALAISAFARASFVLDKPEYLSVSIRAYDFIKTHHKGEMGYAHSWNDGRVHGLNLGSDLVLLMRAVRVLYEATLEGAYLQEALDLQKRLLELFYDAEHGGFFETAASEHRVMRLKSDFDAAIPSVSSFAIRELHLLATLKGDEEIFEKIKKTRAFHSATLQTTPHSLSEMLYALAENETTQTLNIVRAEGQSAEPFLNFAFNSFPRPLILSSNPLLSEIYSAQTTADGQVTAYLCKGSVCFPPVKKPEDLERLLTQ